MERAVFITKAGQLKHVAGTYERIYFGIEFCERLIPGPGDLLEVLSFAQKKGKGFSFVTPYVTERGLKDLISLFDLLEARLADCEVVINDWGVLNLVNRRYPCFTPVLGRLLTKQKRCPTLPRLLEGQAKISLVPDRNDAKIKYVIFNKKLPKDAEPYYKGSNASSVPIIHDFLLARGVRRIELDNLAQGLILKLPRGEISASVYTPYVYISTAFFCLSAGCDGEQDPFLKLRPCKRQCQRYAFKLRHKAMPKVIYLKGNTQFYKHTHLPIKKLENSGVDRIVYEPKIPV